jgi:Soluble lytic murein transglycosylase and related regulatory proteins (some contain LysM/invasin domains)
MTTTAPNPYSSQELAAAQQYGVNPAWYAALINVESSNNPGATSSAGAQGLSQLMPKTAASVGVSNPLDPQQSITGGANYFSQMLKAAGGDYSTATMYYNCGPGNTCPAGQAEASAVSNLFNQSGGTGNSFLDGLNMTGQGIGNGSSTVMGTPTSGLNGLGIRLMEPISRACQPS